MYGHDAHHVVAAQAGASAGDTVLATRRCTHGAAPLSCQRRNGAGAMKFVIPLTPEGWHYGYRNFNIVMVLSGHDRRGGKGNLYCFANLQRID